MNWISLSIFLLLCGFVTWLGFAAAKWRQGDLDQLHEWGLGGRRFGTIVTWFLVGGDLYTACTFIAEAALAFGAGAIAFLAVPYTIVIYPILFLVFPRLCNVCKKHHYIRAADFVRGRFGNRWLALAAAVTGIVATMPYIALQLVGIRVAIQLQLLGGIWIIQTLPAVLLGAYTRWFNDWALLAGWAAGTIAGAVMAFAANLTPTYPVAIAGHTFPGYTALYTVLLNLVVTMVLTPVFNALRAGNAPVDETVAADYFA